MPPPADDDAGGLAPIGLDELAASLGLPARSVARSLAPDHPDLGHPDLGHPDLGTDVPDGRGRVWIPLGELLPVALLTDGGALSTEVIEQRQITPNALLRGRVGAPGLDLVLIEQLSSLAGSPLYLISGYYAAEQPDSLISEWNAINGHGDFHQLESAFARLFGVAFGTVESTVQAVRSDQRTAQLLQIPAGAPVLLRELRVSDEDGVARVLVHVHYRADRVVMDEVPGEGPL